MLLDNRLAGFCSNEYVVSRKKNEENKISINVCVEIASCACKRAHYNSTYKLYIEKKNRLCICIREHLLSSSLFLSFFSCSFVLLFCI